MPLTEDNYRKFYRGSSAEYYVTSKAYFHGFEAHKYNPDFGLDLAISNKARRQYYNEESKQLDLQVKSSLVVKNKAMFYLREEEIEFLLSQEQAATVFCMFDSMIFQSPEVYHNRDSAISDIHRNEDHLVSSLRKQTYDKQFEKTMMTFNGEEYECDQNIIDGRRLDVDDVKVTLIWLNKKQLTKAIEEGFILKILDKYEESSYIYMLSLYKKDNDCFIFEKGKNKYVPHPEISSLSYLLFGCAGGSALNKEEFCDLDESPEDI